MTSRSKGRGGQGFCDDSTNALVKKTRVIYGRPLIPKTNKSRECIIISFETLDNLYSKTYLQQSLETPQIRTVMVIVQRSLYSLA